MATKKDLEKEVNRLNKKYTKNKKNEFVIHRAYGGYTVELQGKRDKRAKKRYKLLKGAMSGSAPVGNQYHDSATNTIKGLKHAEERGWVKSAVLHYDKKSKKYGR